jgi:hypothetical protein
MITVSSIENNAKWLHNDCKLLVCDLIGSVCSEFYASVGLLEDASSSGYGILTSTKPCVGSPSEVALPVTSIWVASWVAKYLLNI